MPERQGDDGLVNQAGLARCCAVAIIDIIGRETGRTETEPQGMTLGNAGTGGLEDDRDRAGRFPGLNPKIALAKVVHLTRRMNLR